MLERKKEDLELNEMIIATMVINICNYQIWHKLNYLEEKPNFRKKIYEFF